MKKIFTLFILLFFCTTVFAAQPFKQIVFFGDSLSDNGNLHRLIKLPQSPPYYLGRFTNGTTWAEDLGKHFYDKYTIGVINYCYGGATTILHNPKTDPFIAPTTLEAELYSYYAHSLRVDKSQVLYVFWIGANDYLYEKADIDTLTDSVVNKMAWAMTSLISKGANKFLILNLPDLATTPYAKASQLTDRLHRISEMHNKKLNDKINQLKTEYPAAQFVALDVYTIFNDLLSNPEKYNQQYQTSLKDTVEPCLKETTFQTNTGLEDADLNNNDLKQAMNIPLLAQTYRLGKSYILCSNANEHIFWDFVHPIANVHQILSDIVVQQLELAGLG